MQAKQQEIQMKDRLNQRDNQTKIQVAEINSQAEMAILELKNNMTEMDEVIDAQSEPEDYSQEAKDKLMETMRQFDERIKLDRDKFEFEKTKTAKD